MLNLMTIGRKIYNIHNPREAHRLAIFIARGTLHMGKMQELYDFFMHDELLAKILAKNPYPLEQITRAFFFYRSKFAERMNLIKEHYSFVADKFLPRWAEELALNGRYEVWRHDENWRTVLLFSEGQRKEGLLSLMMYYHRAELYQTIFWFQRDKDGKLALYIGAMQGPNTADATEIIKETTKLAQRYRTKNLILYQTRALSRALGVEKIYAVSNEGYYANNHVRRDRKLKTDFGAFWQEADGFLTEDSRFYELPLVEHRKSTEEIPTRKRAVYRRRFEFLDDVDEQIAANVAKICRNDG